MNAALPCPFCWFAVDTDDDDTLYPSGICWRVENGIRHYILWKDRRDGVDGLVWGIHCNEHMGGCGAEMYGDSDEEVVKKWNRRAPTSP